MDDVNSCRTSEALVILAIFLIYTHLGVVSAEDVTRCSFYREGASCDEMLTHCRTDITNILVDKNTILSEKNNKCLKDLNSWKEGRGQVFFAYGIATVALAFAFYYSRKIRKLEKIQEGH